MLITLGTTFLFLPIMNALGKYEDLAGKKKNSERKMTFSPYYDREGWTVIEDYSDENRIDESRYDDRTPQDYYSSINMNTDDYSDNFLPSPIDRNAVYRTKERYIAPDTVSSEDKSGPSQAPGILLAAIDLLDFALNYRRRGISDRLYFDQYPNVTLSDQVSIDTVSAVQELLLKFLEWGAFIATDLLFQIFWPV